LSDLKISNFKKWALATTLATYFLIFMGGLVRVAGAGLGCPDWPKCFGSWLPPLNINQLPAEIDPNTFNLVLAWIEYINRLCGVLVGFLILLTAYLAVKNFRKVRKIWIPSVLAVLLVLLQGWHGSVVVSSKLEPLIVSVHLILAIFIVSFLLYAAQVATYLEVNPSLQASKDNSYRKWILLLWLAGFIQIMLGTQLRSAVEHLLVMYPLLLEMEILQNIKFIDVLHASSGLILGLLCCFILFPLLRSTSTLSLNLKWATRSVMIAIFLQILLGLAMQISGIWQILQIFHLWVATLYLGFVLILYLELSYRRE